MYSLSRFAAALVAAALCLTAGADRVAPAPPFTQTDAAAWINSPPLTVEALRGKVVVLDVWTYECWNCYRSIPWLKTLEARFAKDAFQLIGIHTPEFEREKKRANVEAAIARFEIDHPVMMDNDFAYWKALGNRYWPTYYVLDKQGRVRGRFIGETHAGDKRARQVEALIGRLLAEPDSGGVR